MTEHAALGSHTIDAISKQTGMGRDELLAKEGFGRRPPERAARSRCRRPKTCARQSPNQEGCGHFHLVSFIRMTVLGFLAPWYR